MIHPMVAWLIPFRISTSSLILSRRARVFKFASLFLSFFLSSLSLSFSLLSPFSSFLSLFSSFLPFFLCKFTGGVRPFRPSPVSAPALVSLPVLLWFLSYYWCCNIIGAVFPIVFPPAQVERTLIVFSFLPVSSVFATCFDVILIILATIGAVEFGAVFPIVLPFPHPSHPCRNDNVYFVFFFLLVPFLHLF